MRSAGPAAGFFDVRTQPYRAEAMTSVTALSKRVRRTASSPGQKKAPLGGAFSLVRIAYFLAVGPASTSGT